MGLMMNNFNIMGVNCKIQFLGGWFTESQYRGGNCLKGGEGGGQFVN